MQKCAILTMDCLDDFEAYDYLIDKPLAAMGWHTEPVSWRKQNVDWDQYDAVIIRTPWDYQADAEAFLKVLNDIEQSTAHLENKLPVVRWNIDKRYLKDLNSQGVAIVPTIWDSEFSEDKLQHYFEHYHHQDIIIKPCISANADNTFWLTKDNHAKHISALKEAFKTRNYMVQPFLKDVLSEGEFSLFYFNGQYSHAILKTPEQGDFRVQEEHGAFIKPTTPCDNLIAAAKKTLEAIHHLHGTPLYARVDYVRMGDEFVLMEAELIEPSLYFNMDEQAAPRFAKAFVDRMSLLTL